jgi:hypothetical protein
MCRKLSTSLGAGVLLVWLGAGEAQAQFNPNGWIQTDGWNFLMPLTTNDGCGGGGADKMASGNWIAPHDISISDPKAATQYPTKTTPAIDFGVTAHATGWGGAGVNTNPIWFTNAFIETVFAGSSMPNADLVNYDDDDAPDAKTDMVDYINAVIVPVANKTPNLPGDNAMAIATTYINNTTANGIEVEVCTASDDSILVYINDQIPTNVSACRGSAGNCQEVRLAVLPPGISKIATLVWEGGGGWNFRLGIRIGGVLITDATAAAAGLVFLGPGASSPAAVNYMGQTQYSMVRSFDNEDPQFCVGIDEVAVRVKGSGPGDGGDLLDVTERVGGTNLGTAAGLNFAVTNISNGGTVTDQFIPDRTEPVITTLTTRAYVGGADCGMASATTDTSGGALNAFTSVSTSGGDIWDGGDSFEFQYSDITGDFDIAIEMTGYAHASNAGRWGKFGLMARQDLTINSRYTHAQMHGPQNDDAARMAGRVTHTVSNSLFETTFDNGIPPRPRFTRLTRRGNVIQGWASQNAGLGDGTLNPYNDGNWVAGRAEDWGAGAPATILVGFANSEHNDQGCPAQTIDFRLLPAADVPEPLAAKVITWNDIPRSTVTDPGLTYEVSQVGSAQVPTNYSGKAANEAITSGVTGMTLLPSTNSGPVGIFDDSKDIGFPQAAGSISEAGGVYTQFGAGLDIWDGGDDFNFAYQHVTGDFVATARVVSRSTNDAGQRWGRHGLMARYTCHRNSKYSGIFTLIPTAVGANEQDLPRFQYRVNHLDNGTNREQYQVNDGTFMDEGRLPTWHRLVRQGRVLYGFLAEDANDDDQPDEWKLVGSDTVGNRPDELLVGLVLQGRQPAGATVMWDNVTIEPLITDDFSCTTNGELLSDEYTAADGSVPAGTRIAAAGFFSPQVVNNRLRLTQQGLNDAAVAVWYPVTASAENGFIAEFDAYMSHTGLPGDANPADGMTFAVIQGTEASLLPPCPAPTGLPMISELPSSVLVGTDSTCGASSTTDDGGGAYTLVGATGKDIWEGGDDFIFRYTEVTGDFDIAVEVTSYTHATNTGRWGKFGLMARQTDGTPATERTAKYAFIQAHGPVNDDTVSFARRVTHNVAAPCNEIRDGLGGLPPRPRFLRLTRRGNIFQGWASNDPGLADGSADPGKDCNWQGGILDDWGAAAPASVLVGYANSEHGDVNCGPQTIKIRLLSINPAGGAHVTLRGGGGGALGYDGGSIVAMTEGHPSFSVEMDNWVGGGEPANEPGDGGSTGNDGAYHFGLNVNGSVASIQTNVDFGVPTSSLPAIFAEMPGGAMGVHVEVQYASNGQIDVFATSNDGSTPRTHVLSTNIPAISGPFLVGFTGGTGGANATQEVDNLVVTGACCEATDNVTITGPENAHTGTEVDLGTVVGGADNGTASYSWSITAGTATFVGATNEASATITTDTVGLVTVQVVYDDGACEGVDATDTITIDFEPLGGTQKPGDMNQDGLFNLSDPIATLNFLFVGGDVLPPPCGDNTIVHASNLILLDSNNDGAINLSDPVYDLNFLFVGGPRPVSCADDTCPCLSIPDCPGIDHGDCAP